ncbi:MAG: hypothetical protein KGK03_06045 [Candidatus Omnitrophica bacterium]|nr:hypothetical protein [Candidatus Omnitrophota bacterium]
MVSVGLIGNAFASRLGPVPNGYTGETVTGTVTGETTYAHQIGRTLIRTVKGEIVSLDPGRNAVIVKDQYDKLTVTAMTDPQTMASLQLGQTVTAVQPLNGTVAHLVEARAVNTHVPFGMVMYNKEAGVVIQTNTGVVATLNPAKDVLVVENKHCELTTSALVDPQTMASLHPGQMVSVKMQMGNPRALSVMAGK